MESRDSAYCRLCAEIKPSSLLQNLDIDLIKRKEIMEKLERVNASADLTLEILPKTICMMCISDLNSAFHFVMNVENAQKMLHKLNLSQEIKKEELNSDEETYEPSEPEEYFKDKTKETDKTREKLDNKAKTILKSDASVDLDGVPLSQLKSKWEDHLWICAHCETQFSSLGELQIHSMQYHSCCNPYKCLYCNVRKAKLATFIIHLRRHFKGLGLSCPKCLMEFKTTHWTRYHNKHVHLMSDNVCAGCEMTFLTKDALSQHTKVYYKSWKIGLQIQKLKNGSTCSVCKKVFKSKYSLNTHLQIHTDRKRDHICEKCGKRFLHKYDLKGHMMSHDNLKPYLCKICKSSFRTQKQLYEHVGSHDGSKPFKCDQCGRCFRLNRQLKSHLIIHTDSLPHVCSFCSKAFRFKSILNQHIRQHTGLKPYSCGICQRDFTNWPNYNKHMKRQHNINTAKKKRTPDGVYPIDPLTGEVVLPKNDETLEWKEKMLTMNKNKRGKGRPKQIIKTEKNENALYIGKEKIL